MSINQTSKEELLEINDKYNKLIFSKILPLLDINPSELNQLSVDMYNIVICSRIDSINNEFKKNTEEIEYLKKENSKLTKTALYLAREVSSMQDSEIESNKLESGESSGEDIEFTDNEEESDWSEHSSDREFIDDSEL